jgi:murein L,D-transpeptidase YafK
MTDRGPPRPVRRRDVLAGLAGLAATSAGAKAESWADGENALRIVVIKSERRLMLVRAKAAFITFPIALGRHPKGRKRKQGDGRTPEGDYVIDRFDAASRYHRALHISYPNAEDLRRARTLGVSPGNDIEIHGMPKGFEDYDPRSFTRDWTDGCIAVSNRAIEIIWRNVALGTPVIIKA